MKTADWSSLLIMVNNAHELLPHVPLRALRMCLRKCSGLAYVAPHDTQTEAEAEVADSMSSASWSEDSRSDEDQVIGKHPLGHHCRDLDQALHSLFSIPPQRDLAGCISLAVVPAYSEPDSCIVV